jgi:magnesium-transporting ATPase (P-type)
VAGLILMTQRWSTFGAVLFLPIITNIFVITVSYKFAGTPLITFLMLLANLYLLIWDWNKLKFLFSNNNFDFRDDNPPFSKLNTWAFLGIFYFFLVLLMRIGSEYLVKSGGINPFYFMLICFGLAVIIGLILIIYELRRTKRYK